MLTRAERVGRGVRRWGLLVLVAIFVMSFTMPPLSADSDKRVVKVMTYNMDAGTDFLWFFVPGIDLPTAITLTYQELEATDFHGRAGWLADRVAAEQPYLVSLQEVTLFETVTGTGQRVALLADQLTLLEEALADRGLHYRVLAVQPLTNVIVPLAEGAYLRFLDRNVLLARTDLSQAELAVSNVRSGWYQATIELLPGFVEVNGWLSVDAKIRGKSVRFFATHLEAASGPLDDTQIRQGQELIGLRGQSTLPVILAGDFNSDASGLGIGPDQTPTASMIVGAGYADVWQSLRPGEPGLTWPLYLEDVFAGPSSPFERIDLIFARGLDFLNVDIVGISNPFPSDHAGVVATLRIEK